MKIKLTIFLLALSITSVPAIAATNPKAGATCKPEGSSQVYKGLKFTCVKSGKKLVWDKGVKEEVKVAIGPENYMFSNMCDRDPFVPQEWKSYQEFALRYDIFGCARPYRFKSVSLPSTKPQTVQTEKSDLNDINACKLTHGRRQGQIAFSSAISPQIYLNKRANIQVIPVEFLDYPSSNSPQSDNGKYFDYIKNMYANITDGQVNLNFSVPSKYFKVNKRIDSYVQPGRFNHGGEPWNWPNMDMQTMMNDISSAIGSSLDLRENDLAFLVVPPNTNNEYIGHGWPNHPDFITSQGRVYYWYFSPPISAVSRKSWYGIEPVVHLHEMMHGMNKLDDHYGDGDFGRKDGDAGTGNWSNMSGMMTDFLFWDKWIAFMVSDQQVRCAKPNTTSTHWLKPSSYYGIEEKMLVVPVDSTKVLVVESMRAAGFNYKIPSVSEGALVYLVDINISQHGKGINVLRPSNRTGSIYQVDNFVLADAPLKKGESITSNGYKISVVESGNFGDVVKVEKV